MIKKAIERMNREQFAAFVRSIFYAGNSDVYDDIRIDADNDDNMIALACRALGVCGIDVFEDGDNG